MTPLDRFMAKVTKQPDGCWQWTGAMHPWGYGSFNGGRRTAAGNVLPEKAHRWSYTQFVGPIPAGLYIDHLCENRGCVNPDHLEPVTNSQNLRRKWDRLRGGKCRNGHALTPANTYEPTRGRGRSCRRCHADYQNARYHARKRGTSDDAA